MKYDSVQFDKGFRSFEGTGFLHFQATEIVSSYKTRRRYISGDGHIVTATRTPNFAQYY
jgi:hypothetical protein